MRLCSPAALQTSEIRLLPADALLHQAGLHRHGGVEGRHRVADGGVVRRPRRGRNALVPNLAEVVAAPLDQMEGGIGRAGHGNDGQADAGGGAKGENTTHDNELLLGKVCPASAARNAGGGARRERMSRAFLECGETVIGSIFWRKKMAAGRCRRPRYVLRTG